MALDPTLDDDDEDQEVGSAAMSDALKNGPTAPAIAGTPSPPPAQSSMNPAVAAYMAKLQAAQAQVKQNQLGTGLGSALQQLTHGLSRAPGQADLSGIQAMAKSDTAPVDNLNAQQAGTQQALKTQSELDADDPTSAKSVAFRKSLSLVAPKIAQVYGDQFDNITASDAPNILKSVDLKASLDQRAQSAKDRLDLLGVVKANQDRSRHDKADTAAEAKQTQAYNQTVQQLEQMRGSPAAGQAEKDIYAAQKANSLTKLFAPDGDLNKLTDAQSKLLQLEVGKIAAGGQASEAELNSLDPATLTGKMSKVWGQLSNSPTPANAGAFLKSYQDYGNALSKDAQSVIEDRYGRVINSKKSQFTPEQAQTLNDQYINRFKDAAFAAKSPQNQAQTIMMRDPKGNIRAVPTAQKDAAIAAGGTLVQ